MSDWLLSGLARVRAPGGGVQGGGVLVDDRHVLTCAHVVNVALDRDREDQELPTAAVEVDFPKALGKPVDATVLECAWIPVGDDGRGDLALLRLEGDAPTACGAPPLLCPLEVTDHAFSAQGFPKGSEDLVFGGEATGTIRGPTGAGAEWNQLNHDPSSAYRVQLGFSGSPVWDQRAEAVVGIVVATDYMLADSVRPGTDAGFMIPLGVAVRAWPKLAERIGWSIRFDPRRDTHWVPPRAGGGTDARPIPLVGRKKALNELRKWAAPGGAHLLVVTGSRGSGKSAVLGELVRADVPDLAVMAEGMSLSEVAAEIGRWSGIDADDAAALRAGLAARKKAEVDWAPPAIVIDQLDEAIEPTEVIRSLLNPLAQAGLARFAFALPTAAATGSPLDHVADPQVVDLDDERYFETEDLEAFVAQLLGEEEVTEVARKVAERAKPSFLVARLVAVWLAEGGEPEGAPPEGYPASVGEAMDRYIVRAARALGNDERERARAETKVRDLLTALAHAEGPGLPLDGAAWPAVAGAISSRQYEDGDGERLCEGEAGYLVQLTEDDGTTYCSLFHPALAASLGGEDAGSAARHEKIALTLSELPVAPPDPYVQSRLPGHVLRGGAPAWRALAERRATLDRLDPGALGTAARRAALAGEELPDEILGILNYGRQFGTSKPADQRGLRQLGMARVSGWCNSALEGGDPGFDWEVVSAALCQHPPHVTIDGTCGIRGLVTVADERGQLLAAVCDDGAMRLWRAGTGEVLAGPPHSSWPLRAIAAAQLEDGTAWIAWGDVRGTVRVWSPSSDADPQSIDTGHGSGVRSVAAYAVGPTLYLATAGDDHAVHLWSGSRRVAQLAVDAPVRALAGGSRGQTAEVVAGDDNGQVSVWQLQADELDGFARLASPPRLDPQSHLTGGPRDWVRTICSYAEGEQWRLVAAGDDCEVRLWEKVTSAAESLGSHEGPVLASASCAVGGRRMLATGGADRKVRLWDPSSKEAVGLPLTGHQNEVRGVAAYEVEGAASIASAGAGGTLRIWDPRHAEGSGLRGDGESPVTAVAAFGAGEEAVAVTGHEDGWMRFWDPASGKQVSDGYRGHRGAVRVIAPYEAGDGVGIASGGDDELVRFRGAYEGAELAPDLHGHTRPVRALVPDLVIAGDRAVATGSEDGTLRLWRVVELEGSTRYEEIAEGRGRLGGPVRDLAALDLPGRGACLAVVGFGRELAVRPLLLAKEPGRPVEVGSSWAMAVTVVPTGPVPRIATANEDGSVMLSEPLRPSEPPLRLGRQEGPARALALLERDGRRLLASGGDDAIRLWDLNDPKRNRCLRLGVAISALCPLGDRLLVGTPEGHLVVDCLVPVAQ